MSFFADQIYGSSVNGSVRHKCLSVIGKLMYFGSADMIQTLISATNISRYLISVDYFRNELCMLSAWSLENFELMFLFYSFPIL